ncbi:unnamed protein product, partial [Heterosigma akashiwo]
RTSSRQFCTTPCPSWRRTGPASRPRRASSCSGCCRRTPPDGRPPRPRSPTPSSTLTCSP